MSILLQNKLLATVEQRIESQLTPEVRDDYLRIVVAGMKTALAKGEAGILASLKNSQKPLEDCVLGSLGLVVMMYRQSRGTMPVKAMIPAAMTLLLQALDFADKANIVKVGQPELIQATKLFTDKLFQQLGISKEMLQSAATKINAITKDPASMERMHRASGVVRDPRASTPTPMPQEEVPNGGTD